MKKIIFVLIVLFITISEVEALEINATKYIDNAYVKKEIDGLTYYHQVQFIESDDNKIVYCIEPFKLISSDITYTTYEKLDEYSKLTHNQIEEIKLLIYYGYNSPNRQEDIWYAITQVLIWQTAMPNNDFYFTSTINGERTNIYDDMMNELKKDVQNHNNKPSYIHDYQVNYQDSLELDISDDYSIITNYNHTNNKINNIEENGTITITKNLTHNLLDSFLIYEHPTSQDVIRPGYIENPSWTINVKVNKGIIKIIMDYDETSLESKYEVCYELTNHQDICTDKPSSKEIIVPYGEYTIKQTKPGIGYEIIPDIYQITINEDNEYQEITLISKLIKNNFNLIKYYCSDTCLLEPNAEFNIININNEIISKEITNENGSFTIKLPYGHYTVEQVKGIENYKLVEPFTIFIENSKDKYEELFYDQKIPEIIPPDTGIEYDNNYYPIFIIFGAIILSKIRR